MHEKGWGWRRDVKVENKQCMSIMMVSERHIFRVEKVSHLQKYKLIYIFLNKKMPLLETQMKVVLSRNNETLRQDYLRCSQFIA